MGQIFILVENLNCKANGIIMTSTYSALLSCAAVPTVLSAQSKNQGDVKFFDVPPIAPGISRDITLRLFAPGLLIKQTNRSENMLMKPKPTFSALCLGK